MDRLRPEGDQRRYAVAAVADVVHAAAEGDRQAWEELVERFAALIASTCRRLRLDETDTRDISQTVWLRTVENLPTLRDPSALPGWLATTTRNECLRLLRSPRRRHDALPADGPVADAPTEADIVEALAVAQRRQALREAVRGLSDSDQRLLALLTTDPPVPYAEISRRLDMPIGSIGPNRARLLQRLRRSSHLAALLRPDDAASDPDRPVPPPRRGPHHDD